jgi:hypothetical protein
VLFQEQSVLALQVFQGRHDFAILLQEPQFCGLQLLAAAVRELGR